MSDLRQLCSTCCDIGHIIASIGLSRNVAETRTGSQLEEEREAHDALVLNDGQKKIYGIMCDLIDGNTSPDLPNVVFVDGPAGSGKTHLYKKVLHYTRMQGKIALAVSMSGIAALLLPGGRTAHSRFRLPVPVPLDHCVCNVSARSATARLLRDSAVIVFDQAPTIIRSMMHAVDILLQELMCLGNKAWNPSSLPTLCFFILISTGFFNFQAMLRPPVSRTGRFDRK